MADKKSTLHLMHCSLHAQGTAAENKQDMVYAVTQAQPDMVSFTEMDGLHDELSSACRGNGYTPVFFANNVGEAFALKNDVITLKDKNALKASNEGPDRQFARYIDWVKVKFGDETLFYHTCHWLAHLAEGEGRVARHNAESQQMAAQVRKHAQGTNISFFSGDFNLDDAANNGGGLASGNEIFRNNNLLTIWDELKVYPNTMDDRTIDIIGSFNPDKRVTGKRYKMWPKQNSDHRFVSAWYEIVAVKKNATGGNPSGGNGGGGAGGGTSGGTGVDPAQDDFYATGGDVDWSDYFDGAIYNLPQAVDDSDAPTHGDTISD